MKKTLIRMLSLILVLTMVLGCMTTVFADEPTGENTNPPASEGENTNPPAGEGEGEGTTPPAGEGEGEGTTPPAGEGEGEGTTPPAGEGEGEGTTPPAGEGEGEGTTPPAGEGEGEGTTPPAGEGEGEGTTCTHSWVDATCTVAKTCSLCGATEGTALGHTPGEAVVKNTTDTSYDLVVYCAVCSTELDRTTVQTSGKIVVSTDSASVSYAVGATYALTAFAPVYQDANGVAQNDVSFSYSLSGVSAGGAVTLSGNTLTATKPGVARVIITAVRGTTELAKKTVYVGFSGTSYVSVTMNPSSSTLRFSRTSDILESGALYSKMLAGYKAAIGTDADSRTIRFSGLQYTEGYLSRNSCTTNDLSSMVFTPGTAGKATFSYTIETTSSFGNMKIWSGSVTIAYSETMGDIEMYTDCNTPVEMLESQFSTFWTRSGMSGSLSYVQFTRLPTYGTLYNNNVTSTTSNNYKVKTTDRYYVKSTSSSNYRLGGVVYVPQSNNTSAYDVTIPFVAVGSSSSNTLSGVLTIHVNGANNKITSLGFYFGENYTTGRSYADQLAAAYYNQTGYNLAYVKFNLPDAEKATLYTSIPVESNGARKVSEGQKLSANDLLYCTAYGYTKSVLNTSGSSNSDYYQYLSNTYYNDYYQYLNTSNTYNDYLNSNYYYINGTYYYYSNGNYYPVNSNTTNNGNYVYYNGTYYYYSNGNYYPVNNNTYSDYYQYLSNGYYTTTNTNSQYYNAAGKLDNVWLVPAADYAGTITLSFVGYDSSMKNARTCYVTFDVETKTTSSVFTDVNGQYSWAADAADFLYYEGIAKGESNKLYAPKANITRGDFMLMLYRAFLAEDHASDTISGNFSDVVEGTSSYSKETYRAVGVAKALGIAKGTDGKFNPKANITREEAMTLIARTLTVVKKTLTVKSGVSASSFADYKSVSSYATDAIADLVGHGVIKGNGNNISPKANITRAEMACILHRVITY